MLPLPADEGERRNFVNVGGKRVLWFVHLELAWTYLIATYLMLITVLYLYTIYLGYRGGI